MGKDGGALVEVAAQATSIAAYERGVLEILNRRLGFDVAMFKRSDGLGAYGLDPAIERACLPHWPQFKLDTMPVAEAAHAHGGVAVDVDVLGWSRIERLSYYQRLMRPHGGTSGTGSEVGREPSVDSGLLQITTGGQFAAIEPRMTATRLADAWVRVQQAHHSRCDSPCEDLRGPGSRANCPGVTI